MPTIQCQVPPYVSCASNFFFNVVATSLSILLSRIAACATSNTANCKSVRDVAERVKGDIRSEVVGGKKK